MTTPTPTTDSDHVAGAEATDEARSPKPFKLGYREGYIDSTGPMRVILGTDGKAVGFVLLEHGEMFIERLNAGLEAGRASRDEETERRIRHGIECDTCGKPTGGHDSVTCMSCVEKEVAVEDALGEELRAAREWIEELGRSCEHWHILFTASDERETQMRAVLEPFGDGESRTLVELAEKAWDDWSEAAKENEKLRSDLARVTKELEDTKGWWRRDMQTIEDFQRDLGKSEYESHNDFVRRLGNERRRWKHVEELRGQLADEERAHAATQGDLAWVTEERDTWRELCERQMELKSQAQIESLKLRDRLRVEVADHGRDCPCSSCVTLSLSSAFIGNGGSGDSPGPGSGRFTSCEAEQSEPPAPAIACRQCGGRGITDDRGFPLGGQPFFSTISCTRCLGDGKEPAPASPNGGETERDGGEGEGET